MSELSIKKLLTVIKEDSDYLIGRKRIENENFLKDLKTTNPTSTERETRWQINVHTAIQDVAVYAKNIKKELEAVKKRK